MSGMRPLIVLLALLATSSIVVAHGGGLDSSGCHTNRKTGERHCHRGGNAGQAPRTHRLPANKLAPSGRAPGSRGSRLFANCAEARAAGAAPVRRGDPGFGPHLDRDNDGVGCE